MSPADDMALTMAITYFAILVVFPVALTILVVWFPEGFGRAGRRERKRRLYLTRRMKELGRG